MAERMAERDAQFLALEPELDFSEAELVLPFGKREAALALAAIAPLALEACGEGGSSSSGGGTPTPTPTTPPLTTIRQDLGKGAELLVTALFERMGGSVKVTVIATGFGGRPEDTETFYTFTSYTDPGTIYRYDMKTGQSTVFRQPKVAFDDELAGRVRRVLADDLG